MAREIKFRVWDVYKKKFIPTEVWMLYPAPTDRATGVMTQDWEDYKEGESFYPENQILSQCTGLKDKNGKEIYEGDVVKWLRGSGDVCYTGARFWIRGFFLSYQDDPSDSFGEGADLEVIGNIYENPELLK